MVSMHGDFIEKTKKILSKRAGEKCSLCTKSTSKPHSSSASAFLNLGEAAHIKGNKPGKHTRYDNQMTNEERADVSNGIWLCLTCHKEIDSDAVKYTVLYLHELKRKHENKIYLGDFDIQWKEYQNLQNRIKDLEKLISEKEITSNLQNRLHETELIQLRIELEKTTSQKNTFEIALDNLKNSIAALDIQNPTVNTKNILEAFRNGNIQEVKNALSEEKLSLEQLELAKKRLLKANVLELDRDYQNAESNYSKAYALNDSKEYFENYIGFLKRAGENEKAITLCLDKLKGNIDSNFKIFINGALGEIYCHINKNKFGIIYFTQAKDLIEEGLVENPNLSKLDKAKIYSALGVSKKNVGEFKLALQDFEQSLNTFWSMTINDGITHVRELAILLNSIGLLYLQNNDTDEALDYFLRAKKAFEDLEERDNFLLATVYLNLVDLYNYQRKDNVESRKYIDLAKGIIFPSFTTRPLLFLQYYLGILVKSADNYFISNMAKEAQEEYLLAVTVAEEFRNNHNISHLSTLTTVYFNYSLSLQTIGRIQEAAMYADKAIEIYLDFDDAEHEKNFNLTKLYMFKAEMAGTKALKKENLERAKCYIVKCNDSNFSKIWKHKVDLALKNFA